MKHSEISPVISFDWARLTLFLPVPLIREEACFSKKPDKQSTKYFLTGLNCWAILGSVFPQEVHSMAATSMTPELEFPGDTKSIWIPATDAKGIPADPSFARAAYENARRFFRYRSAELIDSARRAELLEAAVFRASKARKRKPVTDCARYLFRTYAALVDRELAHSPRIVGSEPSTLDFLATTVAPRNIEGEITEQIYRSEILDAMPPNARWLWERRLAGYNLDELAEELDVSADTLYARQRRGLKDALKRLFR